MRAAERVVQSVIQHARRKTPLNSVPGATALNTVPYFFTFSCSRASR
jgi:hypothetical protein